MHWGIYSDLWDWAGQIRTVDTGTTNTGLGHCRPEFIVDQARVVFGAIARDDFLRGMDHDTIVIVAGDGGMQFMAKVADLKVIPLPD